MSDLSLLTLAQPCNTAGKKAKRGGELFPSFFLGWREAGKKAKRGGEAARARALQGVHVCCKLGHLILSVNVRSQFADTLL